MKVKLARIKKGFTQKELCQILKTSPKKLIDIERGNYDNVTKSLIEKIAYALDSNVQELFFEE